VCVYVYPPMPTFFVILDTFLLVGCCVAYSLKRVSVLVSLNGRHSIDSGFTLIFFERENLSIEMLFGCRACSRGSKIVFSVEWLS